MNKEETKINIPPIVLEWSEWVAWRALEIDARFDGGVKVPNRQPGVYEVKCLEAEDCLTIGKASDLRMRIKQALVKGKVPHSAGKKIRLNENLSRIIVRWAVIDRPGAAEEELHRRHRARFGALPKYVSHLKREYVNGRVRSLVCCLVWKKNVFAEIARRQKTET